MVTGEVHYIPLLSLVAGQQIQENWMTFCERWLCCSISFLLIEFKYS